MSVYGLRSTAAKPSPKISSFKDGRSKTGRPISTSQRRSVMSKKAQTAKSRRASAISPKAPTARRASAISLKAPTARRASAKKRKASAGSSRRSAVNKKRSAYESPVDKPTKRIKISSGGILVTSNNEGFLINGALSPFRFTNFYKDSSSSKIDSRDEFHKIMTEIAYQDIMKDLKWPSKEGYLQVLLDQYFTNVRSPDFAPTSKNKEVYYNKFIQSFADRGFIEPRSWLEVPNANIKKFPPIEYMNYDAGKKADSFVKINKYICGLHTQLDSFGQKTDGNFSYPNVDIEINIDPSVLYLYGYTKAIGIANIKYRTSCNFDFTITVSYEDGTSDTINNSNFKNYNIGNKKKKAEITDSNNLKLQFKLLLIKLLGDGLQPLMAMIFLSSNHIQSSEFAACTSDQFLLLKYLILGIQTFFFPVSTEQTSAQARRENPDIGEFGGRQKVKCIQRFLMTPDTPDLAYQRLMTDIERITTSNQHILNTLNVYVRNGSGNRERDVANVGGEEMVINEIFVKQILVKLQEIIAEMNVRIKGVSKETGGDAIRTYETLKKDFRENFEILQIVTVSKKYINFTTCTKYYANGPTIKGTFKDRSGNVVTGPTTLAGYAVAFSKMLSSMNGGSGARIKHVNPTSSVEDLVSDYYDEKDRIYIEDKHINQNLEYIVEGHDLYTGLFTQILEYCKKRDISSRVHFDSIYAKLINHCEMINEVIYDDDLERFIQEYQSGEGNLFDQERRNAQQGKNE